MYFKVERRQNVLNVSDDFAFLRSVNAAGDVTFDLYYSVNVRDVIQREATTVRVSIESRTIKQKPLFETSKSGQVDASSLVQNILSQVTDAKNSIKQRSEYVVSQKNSDISAKINNEIIGQLKAKIPSSQVQQLSKSIVKLVPASRLKADAETKPVLQRIVHGSVSDIETTLSSSIIVNTRRLMHDMVTRQGIDPSNIDRLTHRSVPARDAVAGTLRQTRTRDLATSPSSRLLDHHLFPSSVSRPVRTSNVSDATFVQVLMTEVETSLELPVTVTIPRHGFRLGSKDNSHFFVKFELVSSRTGVTIDSVVQQLDVDKHLQLRNTPRSAPLVKSIRSNHSGKVNLDIKQVDPIATSVQVFKRNVFSPSVEVDDYALVGTYPVKREHQSLLVSVILPKNSTSVYRVIPVGPQGAVSSEFTNVVVNPLRFSPVKSLSLVAQPLQTGIRIEARNIPESVVAIEFRVINETINENQSSIVADSIVLIDDQIRALDFITIIDKNVKPHNVYSYEARLIYRSGLDQLAGHAVIEFFQPAQGKVDTKITNVNVDEDTSEPNVSFNVVTTVIDSNIDVIKSLLQRQDVYELFQDDVKREREFLKQLIAHNIQRIDLTTGVREDFGVVTVDFFSDNEFRKNQAINPLKLGHAYRYEVTPLLRSPETLLDTLVKEKTDDVTKKTYTFKPSKFLHPVALTRGVLTTPSGLKSRFAKDSMAHGTIGSIESTEVTFDLNGVRLVDASAARFDKFLAIISWKASGNIGSIDHFLIMKDVMGVRNVIGKAHSEFLYGNCQYIHELSQRDEGSFTYVIVPIMNDYSLGQIVQTNVINVENVPLKTKVLKK